MRIGLAEMRRNIGRYGAVAGAVGFIVFLALILSGLSDGLYLGSTGAYRTSDADIFVFSAGSDYELAGSRLDAASRDAIAAVDGVDAVGRLSRLNVVATSEGEDLQLTLVGADEATMPADLVDGTRPEPDSTEVLVDEQTRRRGVDIGSTIRLTDGPELAVVGVASDAGFGTVTAWIDHDAYDDVVTAVRPELAQLADTSQAVGVVPDSTGGDMALASIGEIEGLEVATPQQAIEGLPAASQQKSTLNGIVYTTFAVAAIVVGLFFALVTLEKRAEFAVLKAIGMPNRSLIAAIFTQALMSSMVGFIVGLALARVAALIIPDTVPALFLSGTAATVGGVTLIMGALGALFSFRRVVRIDPATALGGAL